MTSKTAIKEKITGLLQEKPNVKVYCNEGRYLSFNGAAFRVSPEEEALKHDIQHLTLTAEQGRTFADFWHYQQTYDPTIPLEKLPDAEIEILASFSRLTRSLLIF